MRCSPSRQARQAWSRAGSKLGQPRHEFFARDVLTLTSIELSESCRRLPPHPLIHRILCELITKRITNHLGLVGIQTGSHLLFHQRSRTDGSMIVMEGV